MNSFFLDTSVIIGYLKGDKDVVEMINSIKGELGSSFIVLSELYEGVFRSRYEIEDKVLSFFDSLDNVYGLDKEISKVFGQVRQDLKSGGNVIEDIDIFIAATCLANNCTLITLNKKHFERIKNLKIFAP